MIRFLSVRFFLGVVINTCEVLKGKKHRYKSSRHVSVQRSKWYLTEAFEAITRRFCLSLNPNQQVKTNSLFKQYLSVPSRLKATSEIRPEKFYIRSIWIWTGFYLRLDSSQAVCNTVRHSTLELHTRWWHLASGIWHDLQLTSDMTCSWHLASDIWHLVLE